MDVQGGSPTAPPGKKHTSGAKKRRLEALEDKAVPKRQKLEAVGVQKAKGKAGAAAPSKKRPTAAVLRTAHDYQPLSGAVHAGPVGSALQLQAPHNKPEMARQAMIKILREIALTEQSNWRDRTAEEISACLGQTVNLSGLRSKAQQRADRSPKLHAGKLMSSTARKKAGLELQPSEITADVAETLHRLWVEYAASLTGTGSSAVDLANLAHLQLDLHGCKLKVVESKNPMHVGLEGVVIKESRTAFHVAALSRESREQTSLPSICLKVVPKQISVFSFDWPSAGVSVKFAGWNRKK